MNAVNGEGHSMQNTAHVPNDEDEYLPDSVESQRRNEQNPRLASRSPHPYHRRKINDTGSLRPEILRQQSYDTLSPIPKGPYDNPDGSGIQYRKAKNRIITTPSESGTEADDEGYGFIKALPAPPPRLHKGLRRSSGVDVDGESTPLLTPTKLDDDAQRFSFNTSTSTRSEKDHPITDDEERTARARFLRRRRAELVRRVSELGLLIVIGFLIMNNDYVYSPLCAWRRVEALIYLSIVILLCILYPARLIAHAWKRTTPRKPLWKNIRIPASFDPAPLFYPLYLPPAVAFSLSPALPSALLPNLVLSLSALPTQLIPGSSYETRYATQWLISSIPLILSENTDIPSRVFAAEPYMLKLPPPEGLHPETIISLFALHHALLPFLHHLTTTSLLPAELQLMSICLCNLLVFAQSPNSIILKTILWVGGLGFYVFAAPVIRWAITLARVPRWRLRRAGHIVQARQSFIAILNQALLRSQSAVQSHSIVDSDADDDDPDPPSKKPKLSLDTLRAELLSLGSTLVQADESETRSAVEPGSTALLERSRISNGSTEISKPRRNTLPSLATTKPRFQEPDKRRRKRMKSSIAYGFSSLTPHQVVMRKWLYAAYVYAVMLLFIFGPIRSLISRYALNGHDPFGWAIGYLFGSIQELRFSVVNWDLEYWIPLPPLRDPDDFITLQSLGQAEYVRKAILGEANMRLFIAAYCLLILALGMAAVLRLTSVVEVDTRRKVFHGMMVAMLLPTTYIDPAFISLALILILAVFLILDLLRASQLPPLSKPLAYFLTPYVDGRDLRGPVVVSHIFLLIGCAVPLWLSLAGSSIGGKHPWINWEIENRDLSMVAGVVCVGMGDAAASLIGRRFGRRKWPWAGGKSLEGSAAFAVAVTVGLTFGKVWMRLGQWNESFVGLHKPSIGRNTKKSSIDLTATVGKAAIAACGASFMEAVLTGGNDNVVVPVVLWLIVRATGL